MSRDHRRVDVCDNSAEYADARRERRQDAADVRQADRDARTDSDQLKRLRDAGHGQCREALRLKNIVEGR